MLTPEVHVLPLTARLIVGNRLAPPRVRERLAVPRWMCPAGCSCYLVQVDGIGLEPEGILDGDLLVVAREDGDVRHVETGRVVLASVEGRPTVKRAIWGAADLVLRLEPVGGGLERDGFEVNPARIGVYGVVWTCISRRRMEERNVA